MDGESINSQSRSTSQQYGQGSATSGQTTTTGGSEPTVQEKAAASAQGTTASTSAAVDAPVTDTVQTDLPTAQVFGTPIIKTVSDNISQPTLPPSTGNLDQASDGFDKAFDTKTLTNNTVLAAANTDLSSLTRTSKDDTPSVKVDYGQYPDIASQAEKLGVSPDTLFATIQQDQNRYFEVAIQNLPPDQVAELQAAYYMPQAVKTPTPEIKALLDKFTAQAESQAAAKDGVSVTTVQSMPVDSRDFQQKLTQEATPQYDTAFALYVQNPELQSKLPPLDPSFQPSTDPNEKVPVHIQQLINQITRLPIVDISQLQAKYNLEETFHPNPDIAFYNNVVNGDFAQSITKSIKGYTPKIAGDNMQGLLEKYMANPNDPSIALLPNSIKEQLQALANTVGAMRQQLSDFLQAYLNNPDDPKIPDNVKSALKEMVGEVTASTIKKYGLDKDWTPQIVQLTPAQQAGIDKFQTGISTASELLDSAHQLVLENLTGGDQKTYLNYLMKIATALNQLQNSIYAMQATSSDTSRKTNALKLQIQLSNLDQQKQAAQQVEDKQSKMGGSGPLSEILKWVTNIVVIAIGAAMTPLVGPLGMAVAIAYVVDTERKGAGNTVFAQMMSAVNQGCQELGELMGCKDFGTIMGGMVNLVLSVVVSAGNPLMIMSVFFQESHATENLVAVCGGNEDQQKLAAQVMFMVVQVAFMVAVTLATMGGGAAASATGIAAMIAQATGIATQTVAKGLQICNFAISIIISALTITESGIQINNNVLLAQISMIKGKSEALAEELEALVAVLKKLVDKLLAALQGMGDWTTGIGKQIGDLFNKRSAVSTDIAFAG